MAESERTRARERRAGGRQQRRSAAPSEKLNGSDDQRSEGDRSQTLAGARKAAGTAAAAALAGALAGGAKALAKRRRGRSQTAAPREDAPSQEPTPARSDSRTKDEASPDPQAAEAHDDDGADEEESEEPKEPERGASSSEVSKMLERARSQVQDLLGEQPESVSGIVRSDGHWSVMLEVVEVRRVPDTTDVLASYEVVLDNDGNLVGLERKRRYFRSQVEEGS